jgi:hypothetical protein
MVGGWQDAIVRIFHSAGLEAAGDRVDLPANAAIVGTGALFRTPQQGLCVLTAAYVVNAALGWNAYATTQPEDDTVISPFLVGWISRIHAAIFSFWAGVMPPATMLGRSLLYVQSHCVA